MSTVTVYKPHPDPWHAFREDDPLGDAMAPPSAPYSVSKIAEEGVARYCARSFDLPVTIARMGAAYGDQGGLPGLAPRRHRRRRAGTDPLGPDAVQPDPRRRHLRAARAAARRGERAGDHRQLVRRRAGQRAGVVGVLRRAPRRRREGRGRGDPGRVARFGGRPHQAHRDHRPVPGRLARGIPPRGGALLSRPGAAGELMAAASMKPTTSRYPSAEALMADATETTGLTTSARATSARDSTCCSKASSATPI